MLGTFALGREAPAAVEPVHLTVDGLVSAAQGGRHEIRVVEVGQRGVGEGGAGVEDGLREGFQLGGGDVPAILFLSISTQECNIPS